MNELNEMEDLLFNFCQRWGELLAQYDPEKGDVEQNAYEVSTARIDQLEDWVCGQKGELE